MLLKFISKLKLEKDCHGTKFAMTKRNLKSYGLDKGRSKKNKVKIEHTSPTSRKHNTASTKKVSDDVEPQIEENIPEFNLNHFIDSNRKPLYFSTSTNSTSSNNRIDDIPKVRSAVSDTCTTSTSSNTISSYSKSDSRSTDLTEQFEKLKKLGELTPVTQEVLSPLTQGKLMEGFSKIILVLESVSKSQIKLEKQSHAMGNLLISLKKDIGKSSLQGPDGKLSNLSAAFNQFCRPLILKELICKRTLEDKDKSLAVMICTLRKHLSDATLIQKLAGDNSSKKEVSKIHSDIKEILELYDDDSRSHTYLVITKLYAMRSNVYSKVGRGFRNKFLEKFRLKRFNKDEWKSKDEYSEKYESVIDKLFSGPRVTFKQEYVDFFNGFLEKFCCHILNEVNTNATYLVNLEALGLLYLVLGIRVPTGKIAPKDNEELFISLVKVVAKDVKKWNKICEQNKMEANLDGSQNDSRVSKAENVLLNQDNDNPKSIPSKYLQDDDGCFNYAGSEIDSSDDDDLSVGF